MEARDHEPIVPNEGNAAVRFVKHLLIDDDVALVVRAHLYIEGALTKLIEGTVPPQAGEDAVSREITARGVLGIENLLFAVLDPGRAFQRLTLGTVSIRARNGVHSVTCEMGSPR